MIDGEAVVFRTDGRSDLKALLTKRGGAKATLVAFDLLRLNREDLRLQPIEARRGALLRLVAGTDGILFSETLAAEGEVVFAKACELERRTSRAGKDSIDHGPHGHDDIANCVAGVAGLLAVDTGCDDTMDWVGERLRPVQVWREP